eukprot:3859968-Amphidinium_carterae.1
MSSCSAALRAIYATTPMPIDKSPRVTLTANKSSGNACPQTSVGSTPVQLCERHASVEKTSMIDHAANTS